MDETKANRFGRDRDSVRDTCSHDTHVSFSPELEYAIVLRVETIDERAITHCSLPVCRRQRGVKMQGFTYGAHQIELSKFWELLCK